MAQIRTFTRMAGMGGGGRSGGPNPVAGDPGDNEPSYTNSYTVSDYTPTASNSSLITTPYPVPIVASNVNPLNYLVYDAFSGGPGLAKTGGVGSDAYSPSRSGNPGNPGLIRIYLLKE